MAVRRWRLDCGECCSWTLLNAHNHNKLKRLLPFSWKPPLASAALIQVQAERGNEVD
jgi:hypothetical protein